MKSNDDKKPDPDVLDASLRADDGASAEEREEASRLRNALEGGADPMLGLLSAALRPGELDDDIHEQILAKALGSTGSSAAAPLREAAVVDAPADASETRAAGELREALATRAADHPLVGIAYALKHAHAPRAIDDIKNETLLRPALKLSSLAARRRVAVGAVVGALAVAAGFLGLYITQPAMFGSQPTAPAAAVAPPAPPDAFVPGMVEVHSTGELFQPEDFPRTGGATSRIDRISQARQTDLRKNRFAAWGLP
jgi:hypothetical protein